MCYNVVCSHNLSTPPLPQGPSVSAYVTFYRDEDALKAISAVNNAFIDGRYLK